MEKITIAVVRISVEEQDGNRTQLSRHLKQLSQAGADRLFWDVATRDADIDERPGLARAIELVQAGSVDSILIPDVIRLTTNQGLLSKVIRLCRQHEVTLMALNMGLDLTTDTGELMAAVAAAGGGFEHRQIRSRLRRNRKFEQDNDIPRGGVRFGWVRHKNTLELDTTPFLCLLSNHQEMSRANIALHQVELFERLKSSTQTVAAIHHFYGIHPGKPLDLAPLQHELSAEDLDTFRRQRHHVRSTFCWTEQGFLDWIRDPILCGDRVVNKYEMATNEDGKRYKKRLLKPEEWIVQADSYPGLITRERHAAILKTLKRYSAPARSGAHAEVNLFKRLLWCDECGSVMNLQNCGIGHGKPSKRAFAYQCSAYVKDRSRRRLDSKTVPVCTQKTQIRIEKVEAAVVEKLTEHAQNLSREARQSIAVASSEEHPDTPEIAEMRLQIGKLKAMYDNDLADIIAAKEARLAALVAGLQQNQMTRRSNDRIIRRAFSNPRFWASLGFDKKHEFVHEVVDRIMVRDGKIVSITLR